MKDLIIQGIFLVLAMMLIWAVPSQKETDEYYQEIRETNAQAEKDCDESGNAIMYIIVHPANPFKNAVLEHCIKTLSASDLTIND